MHRVIPHPPPQTLLLLFSVNGFLSSIFERFSRFFFGGGVGTPFFSTNFHRFLQLWLFVVVVFAGKGKCFRVIKNTFVIFFLGYFIRWTFVTICSAFFFGGGRVLLF